LNALVQEEVYVVNKNRTILNDTSNGTCTEKPEPLPKGMAWHCIALLFFEIYLNSLLIYILFTLRIISQFYCLCVSIANQIALNPLWFFVNLVSLAVVGVIVGLGLLAHYFIDKFFYGKIHIGKHYLSHIWSLLVSGEAQNGRTQKTESRIDFE
jgi:hypothetical protein